MSNPGGVAPQQFVLNYVPYSKDDCLAKYVYDVLLFMYFIIRSRTALLFYGNVKI